MVVSPSCLSEAVHICFCPLSNGTTLIVKYFCLGMVTCAWKPSSLEAEVRRTGFLLVLRKLKEIKKEHWVGKMLLSREASLVSPWDPNKKSCVLAGTCKPTVETWQIEKG